MASNLKLDDELLAQAVKLSEFKTKKDVVNEALREYVQRHGQKELIKLAGQFDFDPDYNYKEQRKRA